MMEDVEITKTRLLAATDRLLETPEGRFFLRWLVRPNLFHPASFPASHAEAAYMEGRRSVGQAVFDLVVAVRGTDKFFMEE